MSSCISFSSCFDSFLVTSDLIWAVLYKLGFLHKYSSTINEVCTPNTFRASNKPFSQTPSAKDLSSRKLQTPLKFYNFQKLHLIQVLSLFKQHASLHTLSSFGRFTSFLNTLELTSLTILLFCIN